MTPHDETALDRIILTRSHRLNVLAHSLSLGLLLGLGLFAATNWLILKGGEVVGPHLSLLGQYLIGYRVTFLGSLVGFVYGLVIGALAGAAFSAVYNAVADFREKRKKPRQA